MVLSKLVEGADLFAPGISRHSIATLPDDLPEGSIVGIGTTSVPNAIRGIGRLASHSKNLKENSQGKAIEVLHVEGDQLWALGSKSTVQPREFAVQSTNEDVVQTADSSTGAPSVPEGHANQEGQADAEAPQAELSTAGKLTPQQLCSLMHIVLTQDSLQTSTACSKKQSSTQYLKSSQSNPILFLSPLPSSWTHTSSLPDVHQLLPRGTK